MTSENELKHTTETPVEEDSEPQKINSSGGFMLPPLSAAFGEDENDG
jgi:hypothetical protein